MIDEEIIKKLKAFIKKNYQLAGSSEEEWQLVLPSGNRRRRSSGSISLNKGKLFGYLFQNMQKPSGTSFEDIANNLAKFMRTERKKETFSTMLDRMRKEKGMTAAQLYNAAWIKKQLYSKIMGERNYHPSKNTVIAFGLALKLNREEMDELLESAGYMLSSNSITDLTVIYCINNNLYDLHDVNACLVSVDQKVLCRE